MVYIKRMIIQGFKSFAKKTEIPFTQGVNVILGPNGSGKSNVSDALCFALGRLSIKSMRAAKAKNLLFMGSKYVKPAREAYVEIVFDNSDRSFPLDQEEIVLKRIVRYNGSGVYKINGENKTRIEIIELLAQAGIDPHGFNIVLQGQIQSVVKMHPEDRRKIIEDVAGISIYENRKNKSLKELDKTDEKLKEIGSILRERTSYLRNLDKERTQALRFKDLELTVKKCKASITKKKLEAKSKEIENIDKSIESKDLQKNKLRKEIEELKKEIDNFSEKIISINREIQKSTGLEQDNLHNKIANLKAEIEGLKVRKENYENRKREISKRIEEMQKNIPSLDNEILDLRKESPLVAKKAQELKKKKEELSNLETERNKTLSLKAELSSLRAILKDKEHQLNRYSSESESLLEQIEKIESSIKYKNVQECSKILKENKEKIELLENEIVSLGNERIVNEKIISVSESDIKRAEKIKEDVKKIDICPLCQSKMTLEHLSHVNNDSDQNIKTARYNLDNSLKLINEILKKISDNKEKINELKNKSREIENDFTNHNLLSSKKELLKVAVDNEKNIKIEVSNFNEKIKRLEEKSDDSSRINEKYDAKLLEIEEISARTIEDVNTTLLYKEREKENILNVIKRSKKDLEDLEILLKDLTENMKIKSLNLAENEDKEKKLNERFKKMFEERDSYQKIVQDKNIESSDSQNNLRQIEDQINYLKIGKAKLDAEKESFDMELEDYKDIEIIQGSISYLEERLKKTQEALSHIGSINMRALEVYEDVKKEYDAVQEKVDTLSKEKEEILKIIDEIDKKKKRSFMKSYKAINELFTANFARLYTKGVASLELEDKENIFDGGVNIVVKLAKGKYFDVTSLSGGEQTLVALSLLFSIQEYKPYHFYVFDEIDAALDKRNSERLAGLLQQYMKAGQYIVVTHNDAIITESNVIYGVSMHDGVSKILSLDISEDKEDSGEQSPKIENEDEKEDNNVIQEENSENKIDNSEDLSGFENDRIERIVEKEMNEEDLENSEGDDIKDSEDEENSEKGLDT